MQKAVENEMPKKENQGGDLVLTVKLQELEGSFLCGILLVT
jgi:hypothetical protein